ncbi:MAG: phosphoadenosine phosphosulfate reductase family protein [Defluviitaleaceae bacterium]|nr:phosphoadenosine phosphosulfate reductase family protein [Defluviitaleaceae bacterium]
MYMTFKEIHELQRLPLALKIIYARDAIAAAFAKCQSRPAIAFSGGKDSNVLWHIIRKYFPSQAAGMAAIFGNTGVEFPESLRLLATRNPPASSSQSQMAISNIWLCR